MATIIRRGKALAVQPLKTGPTVGATLAFLGIHRAIPLLHGSQGCSAFSKIFLIQHFREPMPLQTTAMDQVSTIMGAEDNIVEGLATLCAKASPELIGIPTTGLSETQGSDVEQAVKVFRRQYPEWGHVAVVPVSTPDYSGCLETGYARAVQALIESLVPEGMGVHRPRPGENGRWRVNVLAASMLSPGDVEALKAMIEAFGLEPVVLPDLADSLDGHLALEDFSPTTVGGVPVKCIRRLADAIATLVIGPSLYGAAVYLKERTGVPEYRFDHLLGLDAVDHLVMVLRTLSGRSVPERFERHRAQLQDAMLDTHFVLGGRRIALALDPDHLSALSGFLSTVGAVTVAAVAPAYAPVLEGAACAEVKLGDLEDLQALARDKGAELLISNSHAAHSAATLGLPLLRAGFPQYDWFGAASRSLIGYRGSQLLLFELANLLNALHPHGGVTPSDRFMLKSQSTDQRSVAMSLRRLMRVVDRDAMPNQVQARAVQVAFATTDMKHVDQHFGTAERYAIYRVAPRDAALVYAAQFAQEDKDAGEGKLAGRIALLQGCALVYCEAIGGGAIRRLVAKGVRPMRVQSGALISTLIADLQRALSEEFPTLQKRLPILAGRRDEARFEAMQAEEWVEE